MDLVRRMEKKNEGSGLPIYSAGASKTGKPKLDRMMNFDQMHMFELYKSVVLIDTAAEKGKIKVLEDEIKYLSEHVQVLKDEIELQAATEDIWKKDTHLYEAKIESLEKENHQIKKDIDKLRKEKDEHIKNLENIITVNKTQFDKDK